MDSRDVQLTNEMNIVSKLREQENSGHLREYLDSLPPGSFGAIKTAMSDYKDMSAVLGDLKIADNNQLVFTDAQGQREKYDLSGRQQMDSLIKNSLLRNDPESMQQVMNGIDGWKKDGVHNQKDVDWALSDLTEALRAHGKLEGKLQGMQVLGLDAKRGELILENPANHKLAAMNTHSGESLLGAGSIIPGIRSAFGGGKGNLFQQGSKFYRLSQAGEVIGETEEATEAITAGADVVELAGETVLSRSVLIEGGGALAADSAEIITGSELLMEGAAEVLPILLLPEGL